MNGPSLTWNISAIRSVRNNGYIVATTHRIVIAGGGLAGHRIAYALQHEAPMAEVTLVDPKDFFEVPMAVPRMLVEPARAKDAVIPYRDFLPQVTLVRGLLREVQPGFVETSEGTLPFDFLVLATGACYADPLIKAHGGTAEERRHHFAAWAERIRQANHIVIAGGGPVGVEIAAEILQDLPGKSVTLFHRGAQLLPGITPRPQRYALAHLTQRGADVRLGQDAGEEMLQNADVVIWCAGYHSDTSWLRQYRGPGPVLDANGAVLVDAHLRLAGSDNIFAVGDITALAEPKLGIYAGKHAAVVIENLRRLLRAGPGAAVPLKPYKPATGSQTMLVTLGRRHGTGHLPFVDFTSSWFARQVKSRDMFIGRYRKAVGLAAAA